jgi:hypothetical protein
MPLNSKLRLSDYDVRACVNRVSRGRGTQPASGMPDNDQKSLLRIVLGSFCDTHYESVSRVTGTTSALERRFNGSADAEETYSTAS